MAVGAEAGGVGEEDAIKEGRRGEQEGAVTQAAPPALGTNDEPVFARVDTKPMRS
jgi:hypothetical protein